MNLAAAIQPSLVQFDFEASNREECITKIIELIDENNFLIDAQQYQTDVFNREVEGTTGIGMGVAIPHARSQGVKETCFSLIKLKQPIEWNSLDDKLVSYVIMLAVPAGENEGFLKLLSTLATNLMDDDFREGLLKANSIEEIYTVFN